MIVMELDDLKVSGGVAPIRATATTNAEYAEELHADNAETHSWLGLNDSQRVQRRLRLRAQRSWFL
jgi:hypothetical protein